MHGLLSARRPDGRVYRYTLLSPCMYIYYIHDNRRHICSSTISRRRRGGTAYSNRILLNVADWILSVYVVVEIHVFKRRCLQFYAVLLLI